MTTNAHAAAPTAALSAARVHLKPGRERSLVRRHPWVFSGAVARVEGEAEAPVADLFSAQGAWLARGLWHARAELAARALSWRREELVDDALIARRLDAAIRRREEHLAAHPPARATDAWRLVFSEADGLSGLIVDRYADRLAIKVHARAWRAFLPGVVARLRERARAREIQIVVESDAVRREGLSPEDVAALSDAPSGATRIHEDGLVFEADPLSGQKTGFFLDQRENRARVAAYASGRRMLSAYCYTGAFEVHAARAGAAEIVGLDSSLAALERARRHHELNGTTVPLDYRRADVPEELRRFRDERRTFDLIVLDPPRFVFSRGQLERGLSAYKDVNLLAMKLLTPSGILATFSCSGLVGHREFAALLGWAALDAGREVRILEWLGQPFDHPVLAHVPESAYLKGAICRVD